MDNSEDRELVQLLEDDIHANLEKPGGYRICRGCGKIKNLNSDDYSRDKKAKLGFSLRCKDCKRERQSVAPKLRTILAEGKTTEKTEIVHPERGERRKIPLSTSFDEMCHERKAREVLKPKIYSTDTESSKLFKEEMPDETVSKLH